MKRCFGKFRISSRRRITRKLRWLIWRLKSCMLFLSQDNTASLLISVIRFKQRFKSLIEQYDLRELQFHSLLRTKELEVQYNMARYERERKAAEQEAARSRALNAQVLTFSKTETELRNQLNIYVEKFKQVWLTAHMQ